MTPDAVLAILKEGNRDYREGKLTIRNNPHRIKNAATRQYPQAVVLSCLDSRVPVEDVFHRGIGDIFVARVAGNVINTDILGSLEFACRISGARLIVVLGHENCGAIRSAIDKIGIGNISALLNKIQPAITSASIEYAGDKTSANKEYTRIVCRHNVLHSIKEIRTQSDILKEMEESGEIKIVGAIYCMESGEVEFL